MQTNKNILISIILPLYNAEKYISETIQSVINQTYENWEMIIVDDCSTDKSKYIVSGFEKSDKRIKLISLETNFGGPSRPRNIGVESSKGEYIAFLDADDLWTSQKLEKQLEYMKSKNKNFSSHSAITINENSEILNEIIFFKKYLKKNINYDIKQLVKGNFIYLSSVMLKKDIFLNFSEEKNCISVEDYYLWLHMFNNKSINYSYYPNDFLKYRIVSNSISDRSIKGKQEAKAMYYCLKFILEANRFDLLKYINTNEHIFMKKIQNFCINKLFCG
ncbi:glycosyltransferase family 2 protein [Candidatus Sulfurimonas marisnigri]|uniref:Glycosyltransferase family 2 protein n=1 Tax=Candidatus Sulfurimonas marisnigri TaxID=2740405 RepID=A0A7S7LZ29_9BACT|nr:glycosyltransferase family 2 protein [Candidatus Sulfurimonas marisnigri]QOY54066.1 glycosyltransferase family 2 protein [Candidatus Sulfurimonas marisnigri]